MKASDSIQVTLGPSRIAAVWLATFHAATLLPLWWLPWWTAAMLAIAIGAHGAWAIRRFGQLQSPRSVTGIELHPGGGCALIARDGTRFGGSVDSSSLVLGCLVVLAVKGPPGPQTWRAVVASDMLAEDEFRRLRVCLKWGGTQAPNGGHA